MHNLTTGRYKHFFEFPRNKIFRPQERKPFCHLGMFKKQMYARPSTSAFSAENYFSNSHVQHLNLSCHHIGQRHGALNWKLQLNSSCSPVAVKQKHRWRVKPNTFLWKKSTLKRGSESLVLLGRPCSLSSKSDITPGNLGNEQEYFVLREKNYFM